MSSVGVSFRIGLFALVAVWSGAVFGQSYQFATQFGMQGTGNGQFGRPHNLAFDSDGNIYVSDFDNDRVQKLDRRGGFIMAWGSTGNGNGQFNGPVGIAVDGNDDVYVVELLNHRVQKFDRDGNFLLSWGSQGSGTGQFNAPSDIAAAPDGSIYVADRSNHRIQQFSGTGGLLDVFGTQGSGNGQFQLPTGVSVTGTGIVYVADQGNDRIQRFNAGNNFITVFGSSGSGPGEFNRPSDMVLDPDGNLVVVDKDNARIQVFGADGGFFSQLGSAGSAPRQFNQPRGAAISPGGDLFVADRDNHRFQVFVKRTDFELQNLNDTAGEKFGQAMEISGQLVAIGVPDRNGDGAVDIFRREGSQLVREAVIQTPPGFEAQDFGRSVALQNDILVVGTSTTQAGKGGAALQAAIFQRAQNGWDFKLSLQSNNQSAGDQFGAAVAVDGNMVAVGAPGDGGGSGAVYLFELMPDVTFVEVAKILPPGGKGLALQGFGATLQFKNGRMAAGAPGNANLMGAVAVFNQVANNLNPVVVTGSATAGDSFGDDISLTDDSMLVGAPDDDDGTGMAFFFPAGDNSVAAVPIAPASRPQGARFGDAVALLGRRAIIGSPGASLRKGSANGAAFGIDLGGGGPAVEDTNIPPDSTCGKGGGNGCGDVDGFGASAALGDGISLIGAPEAIGQEGTVFATLDNLRLFGDSFEGGDEGFE